MLENLRDFPRELFDLQYRGYSDGILWGCEMEGFEGGLKIMPGILYFKKIPYFLKKPFQISCKAEGQLTYLKVRFLGKTNGVTHEEYLSQMSKCRILIVSWNWVVLSFRWERDCVLNM